MSKKAYWEPPSPESVRSWPSVPRIVCDICGKPNRPFIPRSFPFGVCVSCPKCAKEHGGRPWAEQAGVRREAPPKPPPGEAPQKPKAGRPRRQPPPPRDPDACVICDGVGSVRIRGSNTSVACPLCRKAR